MLKANAGKVLSQLSSKAEILLLLYFTFGRFQKCFACLDFYFPFRNPLHKEYKCIFVLIFTIPAWNLLMKVHGEHKLCSKNAFP